MFNIIDFLEVTDYSIIRNTEFETLALIGVDIEQKMCTFIENEKYIDSINENQIMIITTKDISEKLDKEKGICIVDNPRLTFFRLHNFLSRNDLYRRESFKTTIGENCNISNMAYVAEKNVKIGNNVIVEEFVSIKENTVIGDNCIIRTGAVIGKEGFEFKKDKDEIMYVEHTGGIILGDNVEIQQNSSIDRAIYPWDNTIIEKDCKIDNLVHIAHGSKIGRRTFIAANTCVSGRVKIGKNVWIGPGVTISNGICIGDNARVNIGSVVTKHVAENSSVTGNFAIKHSKFIEYIKNLSE